MVESPSPLLDDGGTPASLLSSHNASRCSSPSTSLFDGTPVFLLPQLQRDGRPCSSSVPDPQDMAIKPNPARGEYQGAIQIASPHDSDSRKVPEEPKPTSTEDAIQHDFARTVPSLDDLAHLLRLEKYQSRRGRLVQAQLFQAHVLTARTSRLLAATRSIQRTLAECVRYEEKHNFTNLFNAFHDVSTHCSGSANETNEPSTIGRGQPFRYPDSFLDALPYPSQTAVLEFTNKLRRDGNFVAERLLVLTQKELLALLPDKGATKSSESIFSSPARSSRASRHLGYVVDSQTDLLTTLGYASPLETLVRSVQSVDRQCMRDNQVAQEVWATACARLISDQKPGSERFVPAVIDIWAHSCAWPGRERLALWISQTLEEGSTLLEQPSRQSFKVRVQGRQEPMTDDSARIEAFYDKAVQSLLDLLADPDGSSLIPEGGIALSRSIYARLRQSAGQRDAFCSFVLTRWLFSSFLLDAITLPETYGLVTDRYFSEEARLRVLREVAARAQKAVFNVLYPWKMAHAASPELVAKISALANRLRAQDSSVATGEFQDMPCRNPSCDGPMAVSMSDVTVLVNALYPLRRPASLSSDMEVPRSGLQSSASSISGFSLFPSPASSSTTLGNSAMWPTVPKQDYQLGNDTTANLESAYNDQDVALDLEETLLRDACSSIDDFAVTGRFASEFQWAILQVHDYTGDVASQSAELRKVTAKRENRSQDATSHRSVTDPNGLILCKDVLRDILQDISPDLELTQSHRKRNISDAQAWILNVLEMRMEWHKAHADYLDAHSCYVTLASLRNIFQEPWNHELLSKTLVELESEARGSLEHDTAIIEKCESRRRSAKPILETCLKSLVVWKSSFGHLRDKMWYTADIRTSAAFDEAKAVASALKVMGKPKRHAKARLTPPLRHWPGAKGSTNNLHLKTEAQILELLSASPDHGGPNKLSDEQSKGLANWIELNSAENICIGEERLHKLCMEVRKVVDHLTAESSSFWSSSLYARDRPTMAPVRSHGSSNPFWGLSGVNRFDVLSLQTNVPPSIDAISSTSSSHPLSARSSRDYLETRSPALTSKSSAPFWSPALTEAQSPSSATSIGSAQTQAASGTYLGKSVTSVEPLDQSMITTVRQHVTSLLLSELTVHLFNDGSETDLAFWTGLGGELAAKHFEALRRAAGDENMADGDGNDAVLDFDFHAAFEALLRRFSTTCNPFTKLDYLSDIDRLLELETIDKQSIRAKQQTPSGENSRPAAIDTTENRVVGFRTLFSEARTRPASIFRDLQYIAALVPSLATEASPQGTAFWNAAIAITGIKKQLRHVMVETADSIIGYHSNNRGYGRSPSTAQQQRDSATFPTTSSTPPADDVAKYSMADAAHLLQITAKEGDAVAQRELATLYLTNPELMDHIIAPFARPREVFKEELESKWRKNQDPNRCDPVTMCVAHHWMSLSAKGGDALAKEYLKQREEMDAVGFP